MIPPLSDLKITPRKPQYMKWTMAETAARCKPVLSVREHRGFPKLKQEKKIRSLKEFEAFGTYRYNKH